MAAKQNQPPAGNPRLVIVAVVIAVLAVIMVNIYIGVVTSSAQPDEITVYRLRTDIEPGDELEADDVRAVQLPESFANAFQNRVKPRDDGTPTRVGDTFRRTAQMNDVLTYDLFQPPEQNRLDLRLDRGKVGTTLPIEPRNIPKGLQPGMYVDIEAPFRMTGGRQIKTVMERVEVLEVGARSVVDEQEDQPNSYRAGNVNTITIEVEPQLATQLDELVSLATGPFKLHLRNPADEALHKLETDGINPELLEMLREQSGATAQRN